MKHFKKNLFLALIILIIPLLHAMESEHQQEEYLPVVLLHGILSNAHNWGAFKAKIEKALPGIQVFNIEIGDGEHTSVKNPFKQIGLLNQAINKYPELRQGKFNVIGHSQGGLFLRCWLQHFCDPEHPRVQNYISLASPEAGYYGIPGNFDEQLVQFLNDPDIPRSHRILRQILIGLFNKGLEEAQDHIYLLFYTKLFQRYLSFPGYWKDPKHYEAYLRNCRFLPFFNNEVDHALAKQYRDNIRTLANLVLIRSDAEEVIEPSASCHCLFYNIGSDTAIEREFTESVQYQQNHLGLRDLYDKQRLQLKWVHGVHHTQYDESRQVLKEILPFLNQKFDKNPAKPTTPKESAIEIEEKEDDDDIGGIHFCSSL